MINLKIICFFDDVDLSMDVIRICNSRNYDLIFPDFKDFLKEVNDISFGVVIIDMEEPKYHESNLVNTVYKKTYLPIIGYKDKISDWINLSKIVSALQCNNDQKEIYLTDTISLLKNPLSLECFFD